MELLRRRNASLDPREKSAIQEKIEQLSEKKGAGTAVTEVDSDVGG